MNRLEKLEVLNNTLGTATVSEIIIDYTPMFELQEVAHILELDLDNISKAELIASFKEYGMSDRVALELVNRETEDSFTTLYNTIIDLWDLDIPQS